MPGTDIPMKDSLGKYVCDFCDRKLEDVQKMIVRQDTGCAVCIDCIKYSYKLIVEECDSGFETTRKSAL
jgi:hypothetical protein